WDQAEQDIDALLRQMPDSNPLYQVHAAAYLLQGLLRERRGDGAAAKQSWQQGLHSAYMARLPGEMKGSQPSSPPPDGLFYHLMAASFSDELPDAETEKFLAQIQQMFLGQSHFSQFLTVLKIQPSVLRGMWRSPRGREVARQMVF